MRPKKPETTRSGDLFRAQLEQIINLKHELAQLAGQIDWNFIDGEIAPLYSDKGGPESRRGLRSGYCCSSIFTSCPTKLCANAGSMPPISSTSPGKSSSSMSSRMSVRT
jgi:hypothetical protein